MADPNQNKDLGHYVLGRDIFAGIRLNLQHFLMNKVAGYSLHPDIDTSKSDLAVADVGTGTGIWLIDAQDSLPESTRLYGFDIDITQAPPREWLPKNMSMHTLDITKPLPAMLEGKFDVVHIRLFMLVLPTDDHVRPVLQNLVKMLKPGGWLQWHEVDRKIGDITKASEANKADAILELELKQRSLDPRLVPATWPTTLGDFFKAEGLEKIKADVRKPQTDGLKWLMYSQETVLAVYQEVGSKLPDPELRKKYAELLPLSAGESRAGVAWNTTRYVWIGQKPIA